MNNTDLVSVTDTDATTPTRKARRTGKVARLPRKLRDLINDLLSEGLTYTEIIQRLKESSDPPLPYDISERNLSNWHTGGFQDWERHQDRMDLMATKFDFAMDLAQTTEPHKLQELSLQLAAVRMCEFLSDLAIADPQTDPHIYLRLLSALPRISRESLNLQKYRDTASQQVGTLSTASLSSDSQRPPHDPTNPIIDEARSEAIRTALLDKLDDIMGFKSYRNLPPTPFDPSKLPPYMHIAPGALPPEAYGNPQTPPPGVLPSPAAAKVGTETDLPSAPNHASSTPAANSSTETVPTPVLPLPTGEGRGEGSCGSLDPQPSTRPNPSPEVPSPTSVTSDPIENQNSKIKNPQQLKYTQEICPKCNYTNYPLPGLRAARQLVRQLRNPLAPATHGSLRKPTDTNTFALAPPGIMVGTWQGAVRVYTAPIGDGGGFSRLRG